MDKYVYIYVCMYVFFFLLSTYTFIYMSTENRCLFAAQTEDRSRLTTRQPREPLATGPVNWPEVKIDLVR